MEVLGLFVPCLALGPVAVAAWTARTGAPTERVGRAATGALAGAGLAAAWLLVATAIDDDGAITAIDASDWIALRIDRSSALLILVFTLLGTVIAAYGRRAFDDDPRASRCLVDTCGLVGAATLVALPGGPVPLLVGWVASAIALERLVTGWVGSPSAARGAARARIAVRVSGLALAAAVAVAVAAAGPSLVAGDPAATADLSGTAIAGIRADVVVAILLVIAGGARSALVPFHRWLSATLFAPTPVSAIVHAGFVSGAGLLLIRFAPVITPISAIVAAVGLIAIATIVVGTAASLTRPDAKGALVWSTTAQMGFMTLQCAIGAWGGAVVHIAGHGMYKAAQFLEVGDTVSAKLRARRRPATGAAPGPLTRALITTAAPTLAVAAGMLAAPPTLTVAERIVLAAFAWLALAAAGHGMLAAGSVPPRLAALTAAVGGTAVALMYFAGLRAAKTLLTPSLPSLAPADDVAAVLAVAAVAACVGLHVVLWLPERHPVRSAARSWIDRIATPVPQLAVTGASPRRGEEGRNPAPAADPARRERLRAQVVHASEALAPQWPLSSFVAVNPLGGLEHLTFDDAAARASALGGRAYRTLDEYRDDHRHGATTDDDLTWAIADVAFVACFRAPVSALALGLPADRVLAADVLHGPVAPVGNEARTTLERRLGRRAADQLGLDELVSTWVLDHVGRPAWPLEPEGTSFWELARRQIRRHVRAQLGREAVAFADTLDDDPVDALDRALTACGVHVDDRTNEVRGLLASVRGATGLARWRSEWADAHEPLPPLHVVELAAARAALDAAVLIDLDARLGPSPAEPCVAPTDDDHHHHDHDTVFLTARVAAVIAQLGLPDDKATRDAVSDVLALVPDSMRHAIWQRAQEHHLDADVLGRLTGPAPAAPTRRPASQVVFCIDVRSEGVRRQLEAYGADETLGFAGFFGIPMRVRELGWTETEPRCPVLVSPGATAVERPLAGPAERSSVRMLARRGRQAGRAAAHAWTKRAPGAPFSTAEALGWVTGPLTAWRMLRPADRPTSTPDTALTVVELADALPDQRAYWAEAVLRTMGLTEGFARIVLLCGHTSATVNNPHATALECGACGGAGGAANARAVAALLNDRVVRRALARNGIAIPDDTWFAGAVHDTASDTITVLDRHLAPSGHRAELAALEQRLGDAGQRHATRRAHHLPGTPQRVHARGRDWAQPRPEWGLATNAAFVIAPRAVTAAIDLDGRAFLHSYDADRDPDGAVLEAIMTAPLVVGHWISSQYYFSTVDPETYGAGDKLLHNPVGSIGVITGSAGDLRVGLPLQSTHLDGRAFHRPVRLLAVVQADLTTIETIIARNPVLSRLVSGSWIRIAARANAGEPWATRTPAGTWCTVPLAPAAAATMVPA